MPLDQNIITALIQEHGMPEVLLALHAEVACYWDAISRVDRERANQWFTLAEMLDRAASYANRHQLKGNGT